MKTHAIQFGKYAITGTVAGMINLGILYALTAIFGLYYLFSASMAFFISMTIGFFVNQKWTFQMGNIEFLKYKKYSLVNVFILFINVGILFLLVEYFNIWYFFAQIIALTFLGSLNFIIQKNWTFK